MGHSNVARVIADWPDLHPTPRLLLTFMAHTSLDPERPRDDGRPPNRVYVGALEMATWLGYERNKNWKGEILKVLRALIDAGAVKRVSAGYRGSRAEYELTLDRFVAVDAKTFP